MSANMTECKVYKTLKHLKNSHGPTLLSDIGGMSLRPWVCWTFACLYFATWHVFGFNFLFYFETNLLSPPTRLKKLGLLKKIQRRQAYKFLKQSLKLQSMHDGHHSLHFPVRVLADIHVTRYAGNVVSAVCINVLFRWLTNKWNKKWKMETQIWPQTHSCELLPVWSAGGFFSLRHSLSPSTNVNLDNEILFLSCLLSPHIQALKLENCMHTRTQA